MTTTRTRSCGEGVYRKKNRGTLLNYWNNFPRFLFLTDWNGDADAFPSA